MRHARRARRVVVQNITFALTIKLAFVLLTLFGAASMWAAIAADTGATLVVIANGLRLLRPGGAGSGRDLPLHGRNREC